MAAGEYVIVLRFGKVPKYEWFIDTTYISSDALHWNLFDGKSQWICESVAAKS